MFITTRLANGRLPLLIILASFCLITIMFHAFDNNFWQTPVVWEEPAHRVVENTTLPTSSGPTPPQPTLSIPKKLWYKLGPTGLTDGTRDWTASCIEKNPEWRPKYVTDAAADMYVAEKYAQRPDIVQAYLGLRIPILKADFFRYLALYDQGGVWFDLDVECLDVPMNEWIPNEYRNKANLVVGVEFDGGYECNFDRQFQIWTIMAAKGLDHIGFVIDEFVSVLQETAKEHKVTIQDLKLNMVGDVVDFSGPRRFTVEILKSLSLNLDRKVENKELCNVTQPRLIGDVLVMPGKSFADSMNRFDKEKGQEDPYKGPKLVTHHYAGTWKNDHGGEEEPPAPA